MEKTEEKKESEWVNSDQEHPDNVFLTMLRSMQNVKTMCEEQLQNYEKLSVEFPTRIKKWMDAKEEEQNSNKAQEDFFKQKKERMTNLMAKMEKTINDS